MKITFEQNGQCYAADSTKPLPIAIPVNFNGAQPNAYGVAQATSYACEAGEIVGDTRRGGSCNFEQISIIPHCNGTHTECVGHIADLRISIHECLKDALIPATLVSISPIRNADGDDLIVGELLVDAISRIGKRDFQKGIIIRTLPNDDSKLTREYLNKIPPYFSVEAIEYLVSIGAEHLLVDLPSIDRIYDEGKLQNHRVFWNVETGSNATNPQTRVNATITELCYISNEIKDGAYLLNLQIAPFTSDAAPSRPVLFEIARD